MDNHALLLTADAMNTSSYIFDEENIHGYLHDNFVPWFPNIHRLQSAVSLANHAPLDCEPYSTDYIDIEPSPNSTESSLDVHSMTNTNLACGAPPWSGYDTRMYWAGRNTAEVEPSTEFANVSVQAQDQWLVDKGNATFSDDICIAQTGGFGEYNSDLLWNTTAPPSVTQGTHLSYLPSSAPTSCADSCFNESMFDWEDAHHRYDSMEPSAGASHHDPHVYHDTDTLYTNAPKEPRYICENCSRQFRRQPDLLRHKRTMHEGSQRYRCAVEQCSKAGKIWTRLDSFKQHVANQHRGTDVQRLVKSSSRAIHGADANLLFSVTTPALMQQRRLDR